MASAETAEDAMTNLELGGLAPIDPTSRSPTSTGVPVPRPADTTVDATAADTTFDMLRGILGTGRGDNGPGLQLSAGSPPPRGIKTCSESFRDVSCPPFLEGHEVLQSRWTVLRNCHANLMISSPADRYMYLMVPSASTLSAARN